MRFSPSLLIIFSGLVAALVLTILKPLPLIQTLKKSQWDRHLQRYVFPSLESNQTLEKVTSFAAPPKNASEKKPAVNAEEKMNNPSGGLKSKENNPFLSSQKLDPWEEQQLIAGRETGFECSFLPGGGEAIVVWAFDASPSRLLVDTPQLISSSSETVSSVITTTRVLCGNTACMHLHRHLPCVHTERLLVQSITAGTPLETWGREHVLHKIVSVHHYESILQVALQLAIMFKNEGSVVTSSGFSPFLAHNDGSRDRLVGSSDSCQPTIGETGLAGVSLSKETTRGLLNNIANLSYSAASSNDWPFKMNWADLFSQVDCQTYVSGSAKKSAEASLVPRDLRYGTLTYNIRRKALVARKNLGMNLGDEIQGLAGLQFLPYLDSLVERDDFSLTYGTQDLETSIRKKTLVFANAWYGSTTKTWPPPSYIDPVLVAVHTEPDKATESLFTPSMPWLSKKWPVGVRDVSTMNYFNDHGVPAFVSNCMTTTLVPLCPERRSNSKVVLVDVGNDIPKELIPSDQAVEKVSHKSLDQAVNDSPILRYKGAFHFLRKYACEAKVVLTKRLHSALPTAASGTPVMWVKGSGLPGGGAPSRVQDYFPLLHNVEDASFDWNTPQENPQKEVLAGMRNRLQVMAYCHHEAIADASTKFGTISPKFASRLEVRPLCQSSGENDRTTLRIATVLDAGFLKKDVILPSFINSIAQFNKEPIAVYVLTMNLSKAQECLVRFIVSQPLHPDSSVHIVSADGEMGTFIQNYEGLSHISVATMARLALPQLLPCVSKLIWLDIDTLVLRNLRPLWDIRPISPCGIAARRSFSAYMSSHGRGPPEFRERLKNHFKNRASVDSQRGRVDSFNAGVMVIDMDRWRTSKKFHSAIERVALQYKNDDQLTLNYFCDGNFTALPPHWNLFRNSGFKDGVDPAFSEVEPEEWGIIHWTSSRKPWTKEFPYPKTHVGELWRRHQTTTAEALSRPL